MQPGPKRGLFDNLDPIVKKYMEDKLRAQEAQDAAKQQGDIAAYADIAGKALQGFQAQAATPYYNRMQDLGKVPEMATPAEIEYSDFGAKESAKAAQERAAKMGDQAAKDYDIGVKMDEANRMNVASSDDSKLARDYLARINPEVTQIPGFENLSARQVEKISPGIIKMMEQKQNQANADREYNIQAQRLKLQRDEFNAGEGQRAAQVALLKAQEEALRKKPVAATPQSPAQKARDTEFGKVYTDWVTNERPLAQDNLKRLDAVIEDLKKADQEESFSAARAKQFLPDFARTEREKGWQATANSVSVQSLKDRLGSQFTRQENEYIRSLDYDRGLSPAENAKRLSAVRDLIASKMEALDNASQYFENKGTLEKFDAVGGKPSWGE